MRVGPDCRRPGLRDLRVPVGADGQRSDLDKTWRVLAPPSLTTLGGFGTELRHRRWSFGSGSAMQAVLASSPRRGGTACVRDAMITHPAEVPSMVCVGRAAGAPAISSFAPLAPSFKLASAARWQVRHETARFCSSRVLRAPLRFRSSSSGMSSSWPTSAISCLQAADTRRPRNHRPLDVPGSVRTAAALYRAMTQALPLSPRPPITMAPTDRWIRRPGGAPGVESPARASGGTEALRP